jgi:xanthine dehydrogenase accessory factor
LPDTSLVERAAELAARREAFVRATVVRAQVPTSARPGDGAIVLSDGSIEGFVGGQCAAESVRSAALTSLSDGQAVLLRVLPDGAEAFPESAGARVVVNPCLSGGAMEIFLEPMLPPPLVEVVGRTPVAEALVELSRALGYDATLADEVAQADAASAVIVASHGTGELAALRAALAAEVPYIALVASPRRGNGVLDELALTAQDRARISVPAGLDIGARTAPEIALSILAEVIGVLRSGGPTLRAAIRSAPAQVIDPVCGMTVTVLAETPHLSHQGQDFWFCNPGCRDRYAAELGQQ